MKILVRVSHFSSGSYSGKISSTLGFAHSLRLLALEIGLRSHAKISPSIIAELTVALSPSVPAWHKMKNFLLFNDPQIVTATTHWFIHRDAAGVINGAVCFDSRDDYTHVFCHPSLVQVCVGNFVDLSIDLHPRSRLWMKFKLDGLDSMDLVGL